MARTPLPVKRDPSATVRVCRCALLAALAVAVAAVEALVPLPAPVPGMKLGLANVVTVVAAYWLGPAEAVAVLAVRIVLCAVVAGQLAALPFSLVGGICALVVTLAFARWGARSRVRLCCMAAAVAHNCGQIAVAVALTATPQIAFYLPILLVVGTATGFITGTLAAAVLRRIPHAESFDPKEHERPSAPDVAASTSSRSADAAPPADGASADAPQPDPR